MDEDGVLFAMLHAAEQHSMVPAPPASVSDTLAASKDPHLQALAPRSDATDVNFLVSLLASSESPVLEATADALWKLAVAGPARAAILQAKGANPLVALLSHGEPRVVRAAAGALSILTLDQGHRTAILAAGGAGAMSTVLERGGDREAEQAARATANFAAEEPTRAALVDKATPQHLAGVLRRRKCTPGLREAACRALTALATMDESSDREGAGVGGRRENAAERAAEAFTDADGPAALVDCLQPAATTRPGSGQALLPDALGRRIGGDGNGTGDGEDESIESLEGHTVSVHGVVARPT